MPIIITWHTPRRIILVRVEGDITLEAFEQNARALRRMLDQSGPPVHVIIDLTNLGHVPKQMFSLRYLTTWFLRHPNMGWKLYYGSTNPTVRWLVNRLSQLTNTRTSFVSSLEMALIFLREKDARQDDAAD